MVLKRKSSKANESNDPPKKFYLHLVSDATGTTLLGLSRACLAQFEGINPIQKFWPLVRSEKQMDRMMEKIAENPGPVLFTFVNEDMRRRLQGHCDALNVPCIAILDPVIKGLSSYLGLPAKGVPGLQHALDEAYFKRMDAVDYALTYDDGRNLAGLADADVILVGVSRTSKTPTCIFLARRGIKAANIPLVPGVKMDDEVFQLKKPLYVGLTESPKRLIQLRRTRMHAEEYEQDLSDNDYIDLDKIEEEVRKARRLFTRNGWPVIDVTRRSIEETSAEIMTLLQNTREDIVFDLE